MQKLYILLFNGIYRITGKIDERVRNAVVFLCCLLLTFIYFLWTGSLDASPGNIMIVGSAITAVLTVFSIKGPLAELRKNSLMYYSMVLFGVGILLIGQLHMVGDGYVMYALDLIFLFPALYFIWSNRGDHGTLYKMISVGFLLAGIISFMYCFYLASKGELVIEYGRVAGFKRNPNFLSMMGVAMVIGSAYLLLLPNQNWLTVLLSSAEIGIGLTYTLLSVTRTAMLTEIGCGIVYFAFLFKMVRCGNMRKKRAISLIAVMLLTAAVTIYFGMQLDDIHYDAVNAMSSVEETAEDSASPVQQDSSGKSEALNTFTERNDTSNGINSYSSGRVNIWKIYLIYLTPFGKPFSNIRLDLSTQTEIRAHNNVLEYCYRCGYLVGSLYVIFYIAAAVIGLKMLFSRRYDRPEDAFLIMVIVAYSVYAMLEISTLPFMRVIPCLFFLTIAPIIYSDGYQQKGKEFEKHYQQ